MSEYTDKVQEWVDSVTMCEAAGIEPCYKHNGSVFNILPSRALITLDIKEYLFPIAVVEGKPVFVGDELYGKDGDKIKIRGGSFGGVLWTYNFDVLSWNPPKNTVMVEMLVEDAEYYSCTRQATICEIEAMVTRRANACRKALEKMK